MRPGWRPQSARSLGETQRRGLGSVDDAGRGRVTEAVAAIGRASGSARLGLWVFALTCISAAVAAASDLHTGSYRTLAYLAVAVALGTMGVVLTNRMPAHPISWVMAAAGLWGALGGLS